MLNIDDTKKKRIEQVRIWNALKAGHGKRAGTGIFPGTRRNCKITAKQLLELKEYHKLGWTSIYQNTLSGWLWMVIMTILYPLINRNEGFVMNKLLRNSLSIAFIVVSVYGILIAAFQVIYVLPFYLVYAEYTFYEGLHCLGTLIVLALLMIILIKTTKYLIINIGVEPKCLIKDQKKSGLN